MKKLLLLIFSCCYLCIVNAQDITTTLEYAHKQYENKQFDEAIQSYRRVLFFDAQQGNNVYLRLAYSYWEAYQDWKKAVYYFELAYQVETNSQKKIDIVFTKIQLYLLVHKYDYVELELAFLNEDIISHDIFLRKRFYQGVNSFQQKKYHDSEKYLLECLQQDSVAQAKLVHNFAYFYNTQKRFNPRKIRLMSIFVPGLGQMYCGDWKSGVNSILLTTSLATVFTFTVQSYTFLDAGLTVFPWFQRYYAGGYKKAYKIAQHRIEDEKDKTYQEVISIISQSKINK